MNVLYGKSFSKDLKKRKDKILKERVELVITEVKRARDRSELSNIEKRYTGSFLK